MIISRRCTMTLKFILESEEGEGNWKLRLFFNFLKLMERRRSGFRRIRVVDISGTGNEKWWREEPPRSFISHLTAGICERHQLQNKGFIF